MQTDLDPFVVYEISLAKVKDVTHWFLTRAQKEWQTLKHLFTERHPMRQDITEMLHYMKLHTHTVAFVCTWMGLAHILLGKNSSFVKSTLLQWI